MDGISDPRIATEIAFVLERATALAVDCRAVLDVCEGWSPGCLKKAFLFPWGIDLTAYSPTTANSSRLRLLCTRTWAPIYGIETLLKAFSQAAKLEPRVDLVLAADGPLFQVILGLIKDLRLEDRIQLPGRLPESSLPALFSAVDGYVSASLSDGTSISLLEAMASALPVIVSDIPPNHEWVTRGESGWIAEPGDVDGYADAILSFARTQSSSRRAMGERNREVTLARGDWSINRVALWRALRFAGSGGGV
jgi:glycosyltransferase involved in cell wall biosynthesis